MNEVITTYRGTKLILDVDFAEDVTFEEREEINELIRNKLNVLFHLKGNVKEFSLTEYDGLPSDYHIQEGMGCYWIGKRVGMSGLLDGVAVPK